MIQRYRLLQALRNAGDAGLSSWDAVHTLGMLRAGARLKELREEGFEIETLRDPSVNGQARFRYVLRAEPESSWGEAQSPAERQPTGMVTGVSPHEDALFEIPQRTRSAITGREF